MTAAAPHRTVIFLHLPKTAGTTLTGILRRRYDRASLVTIRRDELHEFACLPDARKAALTVIAGHMPFGLHEALPQPATYVTVLREPLSRVQSLYCHVRRDHQHYLHADVTSRHMSLQEFVASGLSVEADNAQTRDLSGDGIVLQPFPETGTPFGQCSSAMLERAKQNVATHFSVAGLSDRFALAANCPPGGVFRLPPHVAVHVAVHVTGHARPSKRMFQQNQRRSSWRLRPWCNRSPIC